MTADFLLDVRVDGRPKQAARAVKPTSKLADGPRPPPKLRLRASGALRQVGRIVGDALATARAGAAF